jgi:hypothetical protein
VIDAGHVIEQCNDNDTAWCGVCVNGGGGCGVQMEGIIASHEEDIKERLRAEVSAEVESVRSKLREDAAVKREALRSQWEEEVRGVRLRVGQRLEGLHATTERYTGVVYWCNGVMM